MRTALVTLKATYPGAPSYKADEADVLSWAERNGVTVDWMHGEANTMSLTGPVEALERLQSEVSGVLHVAGLTDEPVARPLYATPRASGGTSFYANQVARAYNFPQLAQSVPQRIALIELSGTVTPDLPAIMAKAGVKPVPPVKVIPVLGAVPSDDGANGATGEVMLDVIVAALAFPGAALDVYVGPNTDAGFLGCINAARLGGATVVSISWGGAEKSWSASARAAMDQAFAACVAAGIPVQAASGDTGSSDSASGKNVDYPASSPYVTACGGTFLQLNADGSIKNEVVWNDNPTQSAGGGGLSAIYMLPDYQKGLVKNQIYEVVPDVAGCADPNSGYKVTIDGKDYVFGGTSAVAPLYSALCAILLGAGYKFGHLGAQAFQYPTACRDVTSGNNGAYSATVGVDEASGVGSIDGTKLLNELTPGQKPTPAPPSPTQPTDPTDPPNPEPPAPNPGGGGTGGASFPGSSAAVDRRIAHAAAGRGMTVPVWMERHFETYFD